MAKANYNLPSTKDMLDAGVHFGHQVRRWHPEMTKYIYSVKKNTHIVDLGITEKLLKEACDYLYDVASKGEKIVFVGTKRQARDMISIEAKRCGAFFVPERWLGGTFTNFEIIKKNIDKLVKLRKGREDGEFKKYTKKERLLIDREIEKLDKFVGGLVGMNKIPQALFVVDARREKTAIREAALSNVKVVALVDTNTNPEKVDYIIPGNDDGIKAIALITKVAADAVEAGYKEYARKLAEGKVTEEKPVKEDKAVDEVKPIQVTSDESRLASAKAGKKAIKEADIILDVVIEPEVDEEELIEVLDVKVEETKEEKAAKAPKIAKPKANKTKKEK